MISNLKTITKFFLRQFNYQLTPIQNNEWQYHTDAWSDQQSLINIDSPEILDVGANIGQSVQKYLEIFPNCRIKCFEPAYSSYRILKDLTKEKHNVEVYQTAVTDSIGEKTLYINEFAPTNSLLPFSESSKNYVLNKYANNVGTADVKTLTLDEFTKRNKLNHIDILKIDVQGSELMVLRGAEELLSQQKIDLVYSEILFVSLYEGQCFFWDIRDYLFKHDYVLYGMYNFDYGNTKQRSGALTWADAIFISSGFFEALKSRNSDWGVPY